MGVLSRLTTNDQYQMLDQLILFVNCLVELGDYGTTCTILFPRFYKCIYCITCDYAFLGLTWELECQKQDTSLQHGALRSWEGFCIGYRFVEAN